MYMQKPTDNTDESSVKIDNIDHCNHLATYTEEDTHELIANTHIQAHICTYSAVNMFSVLTNTVSSD